MTEQRKSSTIQRAQLDVANIKSVAPNFDLGDGISLAALETLIDETEAEIEALNIAIVTIATKRRIIQEKEKEIVDLSQRLRLGVGSKCGKNSPQYKIVNQAAKRSSNSKSSNNDNNKNNNNGDGNTPPADSNAAQ